MLGIGFLDSSFMMVTTMLVTSFCSIVFLGTKCIPPRLFPNMRATSSRLTLLRNKIYDFLKGVDVSLLGDEDRVNVQTSLPSERVTLFVSSCSPSSYY